MLSSEMLPQASVSPFAGLKVFLHMRNPGGSASGDRTGHYAKKAIRKLGASLTMSENAADLVVFHHGSEPFLESATAKGKTVVTPQYFQECAAQMARLPVDRFLICPVRGSMNTTQQQQPEEKEKKTMEVRESRSRVDARKGIGSKPVPAMTLSTVPYLDDEDDVKNVESRSISGEERVRTVAPSLLGDIDVRGDDTVPILPEQCLGGVHSGTMFLQDVGKTEGNKCNHGRGGSDTMKAESAHSSMASVSTTLMEGEAGVSEMVCGGVAMARQKRGRCAPRDSNLDSTEASKKKTRRRHSAIAVGTKREMVETSTTQLSLDFTDSRLITPLFPSPTSKSDMRRDAMKNASRSPLPLALRIAVLGENESVTEFLCDVVEQLGAKCVPRVFGRVPKPTHLVVYERVELTLMVLLAKALGIPILTPQWLHDAILLGAFPNIIDVHVHPVYGSKAESKSISEEPCRSAPSRQGRRDANMGDKLVDILEGDAGPHYRPIFLGMVFAFVSHPELLCIDHFIELIRILGGSVSRNVMGLKLSCIVRIGFPLVDIPPTEEGGGGEEDEEKAMVREKRNKTSGKIGDKKWSAARHAANAAVKDVLALEVQALSTVCKGRLLSRVSKKNSADASSRDTLQCVLEQRKQKGLVAVPVVSVEWIVQCILLGEVLDMAPFAIPLSVDDPVEPVVCPIGISTILTPPRQTIRGRDDDDLEEEEELCCVANAAATPIFTRHPFFVPGPFAKTAEGPSSAKKSAEHQLDTQQLLMLDESDED